MCDVAYVLQVEALTAHMGAVSASLLSRGGDSEVLGLPSEIRARFDADLVSDPSGSDESLVALRRELGVA